MARYMETEMLRFARDVYHWVETQLTDGYPGLSALTAGKPQRFTLGEHIVELRVADLAALAEEAAKYLNPSSGYE